MDTWGVRHRPENRLRDLHLCAKDTRSCFQPKVHNSHLRRHRRKFLLLSNEGDGTARFCLQISRAAPAAPGAVLGFRFSRNAPSPAARAHAGWAVASAGRRQVGQLRAAREPGFGLPAPAWTRPGGKAQLSTEPPRPIISA